MAEDFVIAGGTDLVGILERHGKATQPSKLVTSVSFAQLKQFVPSPELADNPRMRKLDAELDEVFAIRAQTQRLVEGAKKKNLRSFADYESQGLKGKAYTNPPVTLAVVRGRVKVNVHSGEYAQTSFGVMGLATVTIAPAAVVATLDGDTQIGALYHLFDLHRLEQSFRDKLLAMPVSVELYFYEDDAIPEQARIEWCRQAFYDRNVKGVRPNTSLAIGMDSRDAYTHAMRVLEKEIPELTGRIELQQRQLNDKSDKMFTASVLRQFIACFVEGSSGLQKKTVLEVPENLTDDLVEWMRTLMNTLGAKRFSDRSKYVCAAPAVMVGLGLVGHGLYRANPKTLGFEIVGHLAEINWSRGGHWAGIAGKLSGKGKLTYAGPKEAAGLVYDALTNLSSSSYRVIVGPEPIIPEETQQSLLS